MLASSKAASTSSNTQNGLGRLRKMANNRATQVMVFSPPLNNEMLRGSLPGGRATISMPLSRMSTFSSSTMSACPPPNKSRNKRLKMALDRLQRFGKQPAAVGVDPLDDLQQRSFGRGEVLVLVGKRLVAGFQLLQFFEGFQIDVAQVGYLLPQLFDFLLHFLALPLFFAAGSLFQLRQLDAIILAQPIGQAAAFQADLVGAQVERYESCLPACAPGLGPCESRPPERSAAAGMSRGSPTTRPSGPQRSPCADRGRPPRSLQAARSAAQRRCVLHIRPGARGRRRWPDAAPGGSPRTVGPGLAGSADAPHTWPTRP